MTTHILYAYALGENIGAATSQIEAEVLSFIDGRSWLCPDVWAVNKDNQGQVEVGLNLALPEPYGEPAGWFQDVKAVVELCVRLYVRFAVPFVIGAAEGARAEDIIEVESEQPDIQYLERFLGVEPPRAQQGVEGPTSPPSAEPHP